MRCDEGPERAASRPGRPPRVVWIAAPGPDARLRDALRDHGYALLHVEPGATAVDIGVGLRPDAMVLAPDAPDLAAATAAVSRVRRTYAGALIVLRPRLGPLDEVLLLEAGADAVAPGRGSSLVLLARLRRLLQRPQAPAAAQLTVDVSACSVRLDGRALGLGPTAAALMSELARRDGSPAPRALLSRLTTAGTGSRSLDMTISRLRRTLRTQGVHDIAIESVRGYGYRLVARRAA